jgi:hypothetical protein
MMPMSSINDTISSVAATNPYVGGKIASASTESSLIAGLNAGSGIGPSDPGFQDLLVAANSLAALNPAAVFTPSADLTTANQAATATGQQSGFGVTADPIFTEQSALISSLGGQFDSSG